MPLSGPPLTLPNPISDVLGHAGKGEPYIFSGKRRSLGKHSRCPHRRRTPERSVSPSLLRRFNFVKTRLPIRPILPEKMYRLPFCSSAGSRGGLIRGAVISHVVAGHVKRSAAPS